MAPDAIGLVSKSGRYTNDVLNITISSPGYEPKEMRLSKREQMTIVGMTPEREAPTKKSTVPTGARGRAPAVP